MEHSPKTKSLKRRMKQLLRILVPVLIGSILLNAVAIVYAQREQNRYSQMAMRAYINTLDREISAMARNEAKMVVDYVEGKGVLYAALSQILYGPDDVARAQGRATLTSAFSVYYFDYANRFNFFLYLPDRDLYLPGDSKPGNEAVISILAPRIATGAIGAYSPADGWDVFAFEGDTILARTMDHGNIHFGFWLTVDALAAFVREAVVSSDEHIAILDKEGTPMTSLPAHVLKQTGNGLFADYVCVRAPFSKIPFGLSLYMPVSGVFQVLLWVQLMLMALAVATIVIFICFYGFIYAKVQRSLQQFAQALYARQSGVPTAQFAELETVGIYFQDMSAEIQSLKLALYEQQMEQQMEVISFMRLQIKPHFYLNCVNLIHAMVEQAHYDDAMRMMRYTIDYFRYLLRSDMRKERIVDELAYVRNYLEILSFRYKNAFTYYIEADPEAEACTIPPLIIHSFVENAVKHTLSLNRPVDITVTAMLEQGDHGQRQVNIFVTDTGDGFSPEALRWLQQGILSQAGETRGGSIGIINSVKRLHYHFGDAFSVRFYNNPQGGAVVELSIPVHVKEETA